MLHLLLTNTGNTWKKNPTFILKKVKSSILWWFRSVVLRGLLWLWLHLSLLVSHMWRVYPQLNHAVWFQYNCKASKTNHQWNETMNVPMWCNEKQVSLGALRNQESNIATLVLFLTRSITVQTHKHHEHRRSTSKSIKCLECFLAQSLFTRPLRN